MPFSAGGGRVVNDSCSFRSAPSLFIVLTRGALCRLNSLLIGSMPRGVLHVKNECEVQSCPTRKTSPAVSINRQLRGPQPWEETVFLRSLPLETMLRRGKRETFLNKLRRASPVWVQLGRLRRLMRFQNYARNDDNDNNTKNSVIIRGTL